MVEVGQQPRLTAREKRWRAEDDARTLANSEVIKEDPGRLVLAKKAAVRIAEQEKKSAQAMDHVKDVKKGATGNPANSKDSQKQKSTKKKASPKPKYNVFQKVK